MSFVTREENDAEMSEINMTPLVDVMLVLLTIFIVTVPVLTHQITVNLPTASTSASPDKPDVVSVSVKADGSLLWDDTPIDAGRLRQRLSEVAAQPKQPQVRLYGDVDVPYGKVIAVMADAKDTGVQQIAFVTNPGKSTH